MTPKPIVRYMPLCDDWWLDPDIANRISIIGLLSYIHSFDEPPYPLMYRELCVFLALTEGRGVGRGKITCVFEESGKPVFETPERTIPFGSDPLEVIGVPFRIRDCVFPRAGPYLVQFWYDGQLIEERPLRLR